MYAHALTPITDDFNRTRPPYEDDFRLYLQEKLNDSARIGWLQRQAVANWFQTPHPRDGLVQMFDRWLRRVRDRLEEGRRIAAEAIAWVDNIWNNYHPGLIAGPMNLR